MTTTDTIKALRDALDIAFDLANAEAADVHQRLAGYKPHKHAQADRDVQTVRDGIAALDSLALTADASEDAPDAAANLDQIALDTAAVIFEMNYECIANAQLKAKIQCAVRDAIAASRPPADWRDWEAAYLNMKQFAEDSGLDTVAYGPNGGPINQVRVSVLRSTLESISDAMNHMGDALNKMDAVEDDDEKVFPAFDLIRKVLAMPLAARPAPVAATPAPASIADDTAFNQLLDAAYSAECEQHALDGEFGSAALADKAEAALIAYIDHKLKARHE